jgi:hypothetical protein
MKAQLEESPAARMHVGALWRYRCADVRVVVLLAGWEGDGEASVGSRRVGTH